MSQPSILCQACGLKLAIPAGKTYAPGAKAKCPKCGAIILIRPPDEEVAVLETVAEEAAPADELSFEQPRKRSGSARAEVEDRPRRNRNEETDVDVQPNRRKKAHDAEQVPVYLIGGLSAVLTVGLALFIMFGPEGRDKEFADVGKPADEKNRLDQRQGRRPPVQPMNDPKDPFENRKDLSAKTKMAVDGLQNLSVYVSTDIWSVDLDEAKDWDQAIKLMANLDHVYEIYLGESVTDAQLANVGKFKEVRKLSIFHNVLITDKGLKALKELPQLRDVYLTLTKVTPDGIASLAALKDLESLQLIEMQLGEVGAKHLAGLAKLRTLKVERCLLPPEAMVHFAKLTELRELSLQGNDELTDESLKHLAGLTNLENLDLDATKISDDGLPHLAGLTNLVELHLNQTKTTDAGLEFIGKLKKLEALYIGDTAITGKGLKYLAGCKELSSLVLNRLKDFSGEGFQHLAGCENLTLLGLSFTGVTDAGLADIKKLKQVTFLNMPFYGSEFAEPFWRDPHPERFSDKGLLHIGEMTNLEYLVFSGSGPTDEGLAHLSRLKNLQTLSLEFLPNIKGPGLEHLKGLPSLEKLRLTKTGVTDETLKHVKGLTQIKTLMLPRTCTPAAIEHLKGMTNLETIFVPDTWDDKATAALKKLLPKAEVFTD